ncbi:winged helix-turn-helix transcriptional regulator [Gimesia algae]|uniref:Putative HTH-type transcriptional regulator YybR n=1 Tax=Gimesia algae TaxID=2527971 RepID=A0A517VA08_9PLAN|nr:winged helix-turn-helix transcriptional regulator [Gimesia algae]QDT89842.1 putative HTH-type transcriptional regulator YybR [Gimesia algae]
MRICLKNMAGPDLVKCTVYAEVPPHVEYGLTEAEESLNPLLVALKNWEETYTIILRETRAVNPGNET